MSKGPELSSVVVGAILVIVVIVIGIIGWRTLASPGKTPMPPEAIAARERGLGHPPGLPMDNANRPPR